MADRIEVNIGTLRKASSTTDGAGTTVGGIIDRLRGVLALESDAGNYPWGNDKFGKKFAEGDKGYKTARVNLLDGGDALAKGLHAFAEGQREAADLMEGIDSGE